jgi:hypothetical protein
MILLLQTTVEDADDEQQYKARTRNERDPTRSSRWQEKREHAGPQKIPSAILCWSNCDIVNFCFPSVDAETAIVLASGRPCMKCAPLAQLTPSQG